MRWDREHAVLDLPPDRGRPADPGDEVLVHRDLGVAAVAGPRHGVAAGDPRLHEVPAPRLDVDARAAASGEELIDRLVLVARVRPDPPVEEIGAGEEVRFHLEEVARALGADGGGERDAVRDAPAPEVDAAEADGRAQIVAAGEEVVPEEVEPDARTEAEVDERGGQHADLGL